MGGLSVRDEGRAAYSTRAPLKIERRVLSLLGMRRLTGGLVKPDWWGAPPSVSDSADLDGV